MYYYFKRHYESAMKQIKPGKGLETDWIVSILFGTVKEGLSMELIYKLRPEG